MASIVNIVRRTPPDFRERGNEQPRYVATWLVEVNDYIPGGQVLFLAQNASGNDAVPKKGDTLQWVSGSSGVYIDSGAFALDFDVTLAEQPEDFPSLWKIMVTWRAPIPGADEDPGSTGNPPLSRPPEFSIQYYTTSEEVTEARNLIGIGQGYVTRDPLTLGAITTAAGERIPGFYKDRLKAVIVSQQNVRTPSVALDFNNKFENTTNNSRWSTPFITVEPRHARFLRAETGERKQEGTFEYWRMRVSVEIGRTPFVLNLPNRGIHFWDLDLNGVNTNRNLDGALQEVNLKQDGSVFLSAAPITIPYLIHEEKGYGDLPF